MLRGLLIRQVFAIGDWLLILLLLAGAGLGVALFLGVPLTSHGSHAQAGVDAPPPSPGTLTDVKPRNDYEIIVSSGLFGMAGKQVPTRAAEPPPAPIDNVAPTELRLKLCGTSATSPRDLFASAIILDETKNQVGSFSIGQQVVEEVTLEEVYQRKVILDNKKLKRREVLYSDDQPKPGTPGAPGSPGAPGAHNAPGAPSSITPPSLPGGAPHFDPNSSANRVTLKRQEVMQDVVTNFAKLSSQVQTELYHDAQGNVAGITANNIDNIPLAQKFGVKDGDVLQTVNNETIDSEQKIVELVNKYRNSSTFRIGLLRDGKPMVVTYKLE